MKTPHQFVRPAAFPCGADIWSVCRLRRCTQGSPTALKSGALSETIRRPPDCLTQGTASANADFALMPFGGRYERPGTGWHFHGFVADSNVAVLYVAAVGSIGFYGMLIDEWCDGERSVLISTHQVEEVETLLSDVMMLDEGRLVLNISLEDMDKRFVALSHDPATAEAIASAHPLLRYRQQGGPNGARDAAIFDGPPPAEIAALGERIRPSLVDLFMALTRNPALQAKNV